MNRPIIEIDEASGFCFGVVNAITKAEEELDTNQSLYCLGDIVHNGREVERLERNGLITIDHHRFEHIKNAKVLLRAHGEPPSTYLKAKQNNITLIDATCPVVLQLQRKIKQCYLCEQADGAQIVIFGKIGHAEVNGLVGQTDGTAIVVEGENDLAKLDYTRPIRLYAQTTKSIDEFHRIVEIIQNNIAAEGSFEFFDTICRQVSNRIPNIGTFASRHEVIIFVGGRKSSNGKVLFGECLKQNPSTYFVSDEEEVNKEWIEGVDSIGICGATSTPKWLMEKVQKRIMALLEP